MQPETKELIFWFGLRILAVIFCVTLGYVLAQL
jgi:hypothetical protein